MENPFYVEPPSPLKGVMALTEGIGSRLEFEKKKADESKKLAVRGQMRDAITSGDMETLDKIFIENPWAGEELDKFYNFKNEATKQNAIETAWKVLSGQESPSKALIDRADFVLKEGGDPSGTIKLAEAAAQGNTDEATKQAELLLLRYDKPAYMALKESQKVDVPKREYDRDRGQVINIPSQGEPTAIPITGLEAITKKTANIQDFDHYNELKKSNPEAAQMFGLQTGIIKPPERREPPSTAMGAFLRQKPNATPDEIAEFSKRLKEDGGISVTLPDGTKMQVGGSADMTTKTKGEIEGKQLSSQEQYSRISSITESFKPEYQEIGTKLSAEWTGMKSKLGAKVDKKDEKKLIEFKSFQRNAISNINQYINEMTGAAMSEKEAARIRMAQPDPGEQWWKGDDPISFKAKLDDATKQTRAAIARYDYYKSQGLDENKIKELINSGKAVTLDALVGGM